MSLDFVGPLPKSPECEIIMSSMCRLTGTTFLVGLPHHFTAKDCVNAYMDHIYPFTGLPDSFVTDRDLWFCRYIWQQIGIHLNIKLLTSTAFHQQTNGQLERLHQDIGDMLRIYCRKHPSKWQTLLPTFAGAINQTSQNDTGKVPLELLTGYWPKTKIGQNPYRSEVPAADEFIKQQAIDYAEAWDAIILSGHRQALQSG